MLDVRSTLPYTTHFCDSITGVKRKAMLILNLPDTIQWKTFFGTKGTMQRFGAGNSLVIMDFISLPDLCGGLPVKPMLFFSA